MYNLLLQLHSCWRYYKIYSYGHKQIKRIIGSYFDNASKFLNLYFYFTVNYLQPNEKIIKKNVLRSKSKYGNLDKMFKSKSDIQGDTKFMKIRLIYICCGHPAGNLAATS